MSTLSTFLFITDSGFSGQIFFLKVLHESSSLSFAQICSIEYFSPVSVIILADIAPYDNPPGPENNSPFLNTI